MGSNASSSAKASDLFASLTPSSTPKTTIVASPSHNSHTAAHRNFILGAVLGVLLAVLLALGSVWNVMRRKRTYPSQGPAPPLAHLPMAVPVVTLAGHGIHEVDGTSAIRGESDEGPCWDSGAEKENKVKIFPPRELE